MSYDKALIHGIIDATPILHVAFNASDSAVDPFPAVLPMLGCTGSFTDQQPTPEEDGEASIYLHGYVSARLMRLAKSPEYAVTGLPVTVSASILDGLVLALTPFHNSCNYRSAVVFGHATVVSDEAEKLWAMQLITENVLPGRWSNSRVPPSKPEMDSTSILRVRIHTASAKVRTGGPSEDRKDLKDDTVRANVWTGVVPSWLQWGTPMPATENQVAEAPEYLNDWMKGQNTAGKGNAVEAAAP